MLESLYWLGGSVALLIAYVIVSNTLWLLFGSKVIQKLPGVDIKGFRGTLKIALMLFLSATGFLFWISKYFVMLILLKNPKPKLSNEISQKIKWGARITKNKL
mgnify:FL=1|jgi:hypothetical protein